MRLIMLGRSLEGYLIDSICELFSTLKFRWLQKNELNFKTEFF